jgi:type VI protein secretion system component VasK
MEERYNTVSRWIMALAVLFIPLSIIILVSGPWSYNFQVQAHQWTRWLLFASWVLITLAIIAAIANMLSPAEQAAGEEAEAGAVPPGSAESGTVAEAEEESAVVVRPKGKMSMAFSMLMTEAVLFSLGIILYVIYISWLIIPSVSSRLLGGAG